MITKVNVESIDLNLDHLVGKINGEQTIISMPHTELNNVITILNMRGVPLHPKYTFSGLFRLTDNVYANIVDIVVLIDDVINDISLISLENVVHVTGNTYKAEKVYIPKDLLVNNDED